MNRPTSLASSLAPIAEELRAVLDAKNSAREQGLVLSRRVVRLSANGIRAIHRGERTTAEALLDEARHRLEDAGSAMADHPDVQYAGFLHDAAKEYAEARITHALVFGLPIPDPQTLGVEAPAYLNGMGEAVGEMRRHLLDLMRRGDLERSEHLLEAMDEIYALLTSMDYPDAMTGGLRRTTDVTRSIVERTRGDLSTTIIQHELKQALDDARRRLEV
ncbi:MAG TPA: haloacid dehalogenase [Actinomycetota bacterium]